MEQNFEEQSGRVENKSEVGFDKTKFILPGSILVAALMISGSLIYVNSLKSTTGQIVGNNSPKAVRIDVGDSPFLGNKDAKVTIVEFADFRCPFCGVFYKEAEKQIIENYVKTGKVKFVFKHYAFLGDKSVWASEAAECANEQGKFWEYHNWLYDNQASESDLDYYSKANLVKYAGKVGLDVNKFSSCLNSDKYLERVKADYDQGQAAGVTGTPTTFINGQLVINSRGQSAGASPFSVFQTVIENELK